MAKQKLDKEVRYINIEPSLVRSETFKEVEKRADGSEVEVEKQRNIVEGYAIMFDAPTTIYEGTDSAFIEKIDRHAFESADIKDCCYKYNHGDAMGILGRTSNKTLELIPDEKGVFIRNILPDTQVGRDYKVLVRDGYITQQSFGFTVEDEDYDYSTKPVTRIIKRFGKIFDISGVDVPAYPQTSLIARSKAMAEGNPAQVETRATEEDELENESTKGQEEEPKTMPTELENEVDSVKDNQEAEPDEREKRKAFLFRKKKELILLKLGGKKK